MYCFVEASTTRGHDEFAALGATGATLPQLRARKVVFIPDLIPQPDWDKYHFAPILLGRNLVVVLPFYRFAAVLLAAGLLAHRLRLAARTTRQHGGRYGDGAGTSSSLLMLLEPATETCALPYSHFFALFAPLSPPSHLSLPFYYGQTFTLNCDGKRFTILGR